MGRSMLEAVLRKVGPLAADGGVGDAQLLRRFVADRDEAAFAAIVHRHGPLVWAVCRQLLPHEPDAEDAFQATFLALVRGAGRIRTPAALGAWLHGTAYRVAQQAKRTAARRRQRDHVAAAPEAAAPVADSAWDRVQSVVHEEVGRLPEPLRTAFVLCELQGVRQPDAAAALGWRPGTLTGRLTRARQRLLDRLAGRGIPAGAVVTTAVGVGAATAPRSAAAAALALARAGDLIGPVSASILELARGATEVSMTRTKLIAATVLVLSLASTATLVLPGVFAQQPATAQGQGAGLVPAGQGQVNPSVPAYPARPAAAPSAAAAWEYRYLPRKSDSLEVFQQVLAQQAAVGWEYCGTEALVVTDPAKKAEWGASPTMVFKRARPGGGVAGYSSRPAQPKDPGNDPTPSPSSAAPAANPFGNNPLAQNAGKADLTVIHLKHTVAAELAKTLDEVFAGRNCRFIAEPRTNSVLIQASDNDLKTAKSLIEKLDTPAAGERPK